MSSLLDNIATTMESLATAWHTNDGAALARFFVDDGTLVNPFGQRADGRPAVSAMYTEFFGGLLRGTSTTITVDRVRPIDDSYAFVDAQQTILAADGGVVLVVRLVALMQRDNDDWRFVDARPYTLATTPT